MNKRYDAARDAQLAAQEDLIRAEAERLAAETRLHQAKITGTSQIRKLSKHRRILRENNVREALQATFYKDEV